MQPLMAPSGEVDVAAVWAALEDGHAAMAAFRDDAFDKWHAKTSLASGAARSATPTAPGGLRALNQAVSAQVAAALRDHHRARRRCAPLASAVAPPLCEAPPSAGRGNDGEDNGLEPPTGDDPPRDEDVYDDAEFYAQLLKQLLDASGGGDTYGGPGMRGTAPKQRKAVDRRASKGRKLRFAILDKLVNFMAPLPATLPPMADQLLGRLFGQATTPIDV